MQARSSADAGAVQARAPIPEASGEPHQSSAEYLVGQLARHTRAATMVLALLLGLAALTGWWMVRAVGMRQSPEAPRAPVQRTLTRLTLGPGLQADPALSPDARFLAYSSDRNGSADIWVQPVAGGDPCR